MRVIVEVVSGPGAGQRKWFGPGQSLRVGRGESADLVIARDAQMSSLHFAIDCRTSDCLVRDLGSTNGTFIDGAKTDEQPLRRPATIQAGRSAFALHIEEAPPIEAAPAPANRAADLAEPKSLSTAARETLPSPTPPLLEPTATVVARLDVSAGPTLARRFEIPLGRSIHVGRADDCELAIPADGLLSARHCVIEPRGDQWHVRDLGSTNGTRVNNAPASDTPLSDGDEIVAGSTVLRFHLAPASDEEAVEAEEPADAAIPPADLTPEDDDEPEPAELADFQLPVMQIVNHTALAVETLLWEDGDGRARLTIVAKATFAIHHGGPCTLAKNPLPVFTADLPFDDDPTAPPRFESDLVPFKPLADVVLVGKAHAPGGVPVPQLDVSLRIGPLQRTLRVFGDRKWWFPTRLAVVPEISAPAPFVSMDLIYQRAFGGIDAEAALYCPENLDGCGFIGKKSRESVHEKALPNIEDPALLIDSWSLQPKPAGFGFYGRNWQPRAAFAGTYNEAYYKERAPRPPVDFSDRFYNGAHPGLQLDHYLRGDEAVELKNLNAQHATLTFRLPGVHPKIRIARWTTDPTEWLDAQLAQGQDPGRQALPVEEFAVDTVLDTLVLMPDEGVFYEVFRVVVPLADPEALEIARITLTV